MRLRVLIVDNFDSFTFNLAQVLGGLGADVVVRRNTTPVSALVAEDPAAYVLSPGPGSPSQAGVSLPLLRAVAGWRPVLGICLGLQVMAEAFGARVLRAHEAVHGRATPLQHDGAGIFAGLPQGVAAGRYHSLAVEPESVRGPLIVSAWSQGVIMGLRHATLPLESVQFHPESILTPEGPRMLASFLAGLRPRAR